MKGHPPGPELSNPMDPNSEPTGKTIFVLDEHYESPAGIARHWQDTTDNWPDMSAAMAWAAKGTVATLHNGTALTRAASTRSCTFSVATLPLSGRVRPRLLCPHRIAPRRGRISATARPAFPLGATAPGEGARATIFSQSRGRKAMQRRSASFTSSSKASAG
jgi:hypothetical protein